MTDVMGTHTVINNFKFLKGLAYIREESKNTGGAYNVIFNLRAIAPELPLSAIGENKDGGFV